MRKNSLKKINKFVCCLVILSLFLQFIPARQPAQAIDFSFIGKWLGKLASKISIPNVILNEKGGIMLGKYPLVIPNILNPSESKPIECLGCKKYNTDGTCDKENCVNPFSLVSLGTKSQKVLVEPAFIPGCLEAQATANNQKIDLSNVQPKSGPIEFNYTVYPELNPDYITKKITGCTGKPPCLEPQESVGTVIGCGNPQIVDKYALRGAPGCYDWYKSDQESIISKDNATWRTYWEELARKFGTYENIKKVYTFCTEGGNCPEFWGWGGVTEELGGALQDLATPSGSSYGYTLLKAMDFTQSNVAYKNLYEYVFQGGFKAPNTMEAKHLYFLRKMLMVLPSFEKLVNLDTPDSSWWGNSDSDTNSTRRKIKSGTAFLEAGIQNDLKVFGLTLEEIKKVVDDKKNEAPPTTPDCANPKAGEVLVPKPYMLPQCELKIPLPGDAICDNDTDEKCELKKLAQGKACTYLARLQDAASQEVFVANKIFNATDPFTECLFIRNCRSNCTLRLGEVTFTVTLLDVAALFVPGGFLTVIQKILNIYKIIKEAYSILTTVKTLFDDGVNFLNQIFNVMGQVSSLFESFANSGLKMGDVLIYGGGAVASYFGGKEIQKIGKDSGGNIGWVQTQTGKALSANGGLVGGAATTLIFNTDRAKKASSGMQDMLASFAQNNLKFSTAKNEAIQYNATLKSDIENVKQIFKLEKPISFFFQTEDGDTPNAKKKELNTILGDLQLFFRSVDEFLDDVKQAASLKDGRPISDVQKGVEESICNESNKSDFGGVCPIETVPYFCTSTAPFRAVALDFSGYVDSSVSNGYPFCYLRSGAQVVDGITTEGDRCSWIDLFKTYSSNTAVLKDYFALTDPEVVKKAIIGCDDTSCFSGPCTTRPATCNNIEDALWCYGQGDGCVIDSTNKSWREYWETLGRTLGSFSNIKAIYKSANCLNDCKWTAGKVLYQLYFGTVELVEDETFFTRNRATIDQITEYSEKDTKIKYKNLTEYYQAMYAESNMATTRHNGLRTSLKYLYPLLDGYYNADSTVGEVGWYEGIANLDANVNGKGWVNTRGGINAALFALKAGHMNAIYMDSYPPFNLNGINGTTDLLHVCTNPASLPDVEDGSKFWKDVYFGCEHNNWVGDSIFCYDDLTTRLSKSYDADVAYNDWSEKIKVVLANQKNFGSVKEALSLGVSPEEPIVVYKAEKARKVLSEIVTKVNEISGEDVADLGKMAEQIIDKLIAQIDLDIQAKKDEQDELRQPNNTSYLYDYKNYGNCCTNKGNSAGDNSCCDLDIECKVGLDKYKGLYLGNEETGEKGYDRKCQDCLDKNCEYCPGDGGVNPPTAECGNDVREGTEECDDGNIWDGDGCSSLCKNEVSNEPKLCRACSIFSGTQYCSTDCANAFKCCYANRDDCVAFCNAPDPECNNNGIAQAGEDCDGSDLKGKTCVSQGFTGGTLSCKSDCTFRTSNCTSGGGAVCPNGVAETGENCDGSDLKGKTCVSQGFTGGTLSCKSDCTFRTSNCTGANFTCNNGTVDVGEQCDLSNFNGKTCQTYGFTGGTLSCLNNCTTIGTSNCGNFYQCVSGSCVPGGSRNNNDPNCGGGCGTAFWMCDSANIGHCKISTSGATNYTDEASCVASGLCGVLTPITYKCLDVRNVFGSGASKTVCVCKQSEDINTCGNRIIREGLQNTDCYVNSAACPYPLGFLNNNQKLAKAKSVSPVTTSIFDNVKQRLGSFVKNLFSVPEVFAEIIDGGCTKSGTKWVCEFPGICEVADKCSQPDCFAECKKVVDDPKYCYPGCGGGSGGICKDTQAVCDAVVDNECNTLDFWCIGKEDVYNKYKCFEKYEPIYKPGYDEYIRIQKEIDALLVQRQFLVKNRTKFKEAVKAVADALSKAVGDLSDDFNELQKTWESVIPNFLPQNQESVVAKAYLQKIIDLRVTSETVMNDRIPAVQRSLTVAQFLLSIDTINQIKEIAPEGKFLEILDVIVNDFNEAKRIINEEVINYAVERIGPVGIGLDYSCVASSNQFLYRLKCFEKNNKQVATENGKTFEDLLSYMDVLKNFENASFNLKQVAETLPLIEPSLDMEPLQLKSGLSDEISEKAQCCASKCFGENTNKCNYSETYIDAKGEGGRTSTPCSPSWTKTKCNQQTTLFTGQKEGTSNYEAFKTGLLANPLNSLQDNFLLLRNYLYSASSISVSALLKEVENLMRTPALKGIDAKVTLPSGDKEPAYSPILKNLEGKSSTDLWGGLIWGDEVSEKTRLACDAVTQVLGGNPEDIAKECGTRLTQEVKNTINNVEVTEKINISLLPPYAGGTNTKYAELTERCTLLSKMDLDVLENIANDPNYIANRIADLNKQRSCITRENCSNNIGTYDQKNPCIVCPEHFCVNPETSTRGAGMMAFDPYCVEKCTDWTEGQDVGYVCDKNEGIIWDTSVHGALPSVDPNKNLVCNGLGLFGTDKCIIRKVDERCSLINNFLTSQECNLFDECSPNDLATQLEIQRWQKQSKDNQCPKWFCLNIAGKWQGSGWLTSLNGGPSDEYCRQEYNRWREGQNMGYVPAANGIIWDTSTHPTAGDQVWPPKNYLDQTINTILANQMVNNCIDAQNGLWNLGVLDPVSVDPNKTDCSPINPIISFCQSKTACEQMKTSCIAWVDQQAERNSQRQSAKPLMEWPPTTRCKNSAGGNMTDFAQKYTGAQAMCIGTQQEIIDLNKLQAMIEDIKTRTTDCRDCSNTGEVFTFLTNQCNKVDYQKSFARDCYDFSVLQQAFGNNTHIKENWKEWNPSEYTTVPPKWNDKTDKTDPGVVTTEAEDVANIKSAINGFCNIETSGKIVGKTVTGRGDYEEFKCGNVFLNRLGIAEKSIGVDMTISSEVLDSDSDGEKNKKAAAQSARELVGKICSESSSDMRTPLNEVMKVFSILLGVKSYTSAKNGISTLYFDAQKMQKRVRDTVALIKGFPDKFIRLWGQKDTITKITKSSFDVKPLLCIEGPMVSYAGGSQRALTGPKGGQVCPDVGEQFSQLDTLFSSIRQNFRMVDITRRKPTTTFGLLKGDDNKSTFKLVISDPLGNIDPELRETVRPMYERAESIKEKSQLLWALASAINFANENCTCGQSYCPMIGKVPFCVSGLPITLSPLKEPFCHLVWTLRFPLGSLAERLKQDIENPSE